MRTNGLCFIKCEIHDNGAHGYNSTSSSTNLVAIGCSIHDNGGHGMRVRSGGYVILKNLVYNNTLDGINFNELGASDFGVFGGNTIFGNGGDGVEHDPADDQTVVFNNCYVDNGVNGINLSGIGEGSFRFFGFNLAAQNTTAAISDGEDFATFGTGDSQEPL